MGGSNSTAAEVPIKLCESCLLVFHFQLDNACGRNLCLSCQLNHHKVCRTCSEAQPSGDAKKDEIQKFFQYVKSEMEWQQDRIVWLEHQLATSELGKADRENLLQRLEKENITLKDVQVKLASEKENLMVALRDEKKKGYVLNETRMTLKELQTLNGQLMEEQRTLKMANTELATTVHAQTLKLEEQSRLINNQPIPEQKESLKDAQIALQRSELNSDSVETSGTAHLQSENGEDTLLNSSLDSGPTSITSSASRRRVRGGRRGRNTIHQATTNKEAERLETSSSEQIQNAKAEVIPSPALELVTRQSGTIKKSYFFDLSVKGASPALIGRIVVGTCPDSAPNMCSVFHDYVTGTGGIYLGSPVVKVKPNNYIVVQNATVKGEASTYPADENELEVRRGAVGMRIQGYRDEKKLVKSQFYIMLNESGPCDSHFSYVFGYITEGIEVCDAISKRNVAVEKVIVSDLGLIPISL